MKHFLLLLVSVFMAACASSGPRPGLPAPDIKPTVKVQIPKNKAEWQSMDDVADALGGKGKIEIKGKSVNLNGAQLVGTSLKRYSDPQDERNQPLKIKIPGFKLYNGSTYAIPGGIVFSAPDNTYSDLIFLKMGEDALSNVMDQAPGATVKGCEGYGATDKTYQFNDADGLTFTGNLATGGITGVRLQKTGAKTKNPRVKEFRNNRFVDTRTGVNASGNVRVRIDSSNKFENVNEKWVTSNGATVTE